MFKMKCIALILLLGVMGAAAQPKTMMPLVDAIKSNPDLSSLAAAIESNEDIVEALGEFEGTVFAPNNKAFADALAIAEQLGAADLVAEMLPTILKHHLVPGDALFSADLADGDKLTTAADGELTIMFKDGVPVVASMGPDAAIIKKDIQVGENVAVHIIDFVLLPLALPTPGPAAAPTMGPAMAPMMEMEEPMPTPNAVRAIFDSVVDAAKAEGLDNLLEALDAAALVSAVGPDFNGTVFAPTNEALEAFLDSQGIDLDNLTAEQETALASILTHHVIPDMPALSTDLMNGMELTTANGDTLTVMVSEEGVSIVDGSGNEVAVIAADVKAGNAVVHVIDGVLVPMMGAPAPMAVPPSSATTTLASVAAMAASLLAAALLA